MPSLYRTNLSTYYNHWTWKEEDKDCCQSTSEVNDVSDLRGDEREGEREKEPDHADGS